MGAAEFAEWQKFYELEPFGEERSDLRAGIIACVMANAWRGKRSKAFKPSDFMPRFDAAAADRSRPNQMEIRTKLMQFALAHNRSTGRGGPPSAGKS